MTQMMICPRAGECGDNRCGHRFKHADYGYMCVERGDWNNVKCPPCIPYVQELQIGDRVRVMDKYDNSYMVNQMKEFLGKYLTIKSLCGKYVELEGAKGNLGVCWSWKPKDLELITEDDMKLKVGDSARVTVDDANGFGFREGDIVEVSRLYDTYCSAIGANGRWAVDYDNLEFVPKKEDAMDKPKYKIKTGSRQATVWNLYKDGDGNCVEFQKHLANLMVVVGGNPTLSVQIDADILIQWAEQNPKRIKWLVKNGYIELVESAYALWEKEAEIGGKTPSQTIEWARRMPRD